MSPVLPNWAASHTSLPNYLLFYCTTFPFTHFNLSTRALKIYELFHRLLRSTACRISVNDIVQAEAAAAQVDTEMENTMKTSQCGTTCCIIYYTGLLDASSDISSVCRQYRSLVPSGPEYPQLVYTIQDKYLLPAAQVAVLHQYPSRPRIHR